jgi:membrane-associated phospholipid phosphatase
MEDSKPKREKALWLLVGSSAAFLVCTFLVQTKISTQWDISAFTSLNDFLPSFPMLGLIMEYSSEFGREVVWTVVAIALGLSKKQAYRRTAFYLILTVLATALPGYLVQFAVSRLRPFQVLPNGHYLLVPLSQPSFPSGHTLVVCAFATVVWFTLGNRKIAMLLTIEAAMVSFSRVYVGAHFPMDVIGGVFFGVAIGSAVMLFQARIDNLFLEVDLFWNNKFLERIGERARSKSKS